MPNKYDIVTIAEKEIGYYEQAGNRTKYGQWFGFNGVAWCAIFVSWCYSKAGFPIKGGGWPNGFAGCQIGYEKFKSKLTTDPQPGDIVLFDWNGDGRYDHTGIFVQWLSDGWFHSVEGNTSIKNQSNGGQVMRRKRNRNKAVFIQLIRL
jgi:cell wall-associated NlpC family hydrolase